MANKQDKNQLTPAQINAMAAAQNRQELLRQQSLDRLKQASEKAVREANKGRK